MRGRLPLAVTVALMAAALTSCGSPRSVEDMADALLTPADLTGEWTVNAGNPDASEGTLAPSGILTDAQREVLPRVQLCDRASGDAQDAADAFEWEVYRQLDQTVDDPIDPPTDREGHKVFLQESMMSDDPDDLIALFDDLLPGIEACLGDIPADEEGPGTAEKIEITSGGDEQIAVLSRIEEAGGQGVWNVYNAVIRKGSVALSIMLVDVYLGDLQPVVDNADFDAIVSLAMSKL